MELALGTDEKIFFQIFAENDSAAGITLNPQSFGTHPALFRRSGLFNGFFVAFKPGHG
jgi:hypothetical protein